VRFNLIGCRGAVGRAADGPPHRRAVHSLGRFQGLRRRLEARQETRAGDTTPEEKEKTRSWFATTRAALGERITEKDTDILIASSGPRKDGLPRLKGSLLSDQHILDRREEWPLSRRCNRY